MSTSASEPSTKFRKIFRLRSLKARVIILTLATSLIGIWIMAFYVGKTLHEDMEINLGDQQFSTVSVVAEALNTEFAARITALNSMAAKITPDLLGNPPKLQRMLNNQPVIYSLFNNGVAVAGLDGTVIADFPHLPKRIGANFIERDYIIGPLKEGKVTIGRPVMSKLMHAPAFVIGVPIRDNRSRVIGVVGGVVDLQLPNFLDSVMVSRYGKTGGYVLVSPQHRLTVTATDKSRIMRPVPAPGINPLFDRYMQGFEGSGVVVDSRGLEVLSSAKQIPAAGWILVARIPTSEAFAPIRDMMWHVLLATIFLSLLAGGLTWWMLKRQLAPIFTAIKTLTALSDADQPLQLLPITRQDEIGELIGSFNHMLESLERQKQALKASEQRYQSLFDQAGDGILMLDTRGEIISVNKSFADMHDLTVGEILRMGLGELDVEGTALVPDRIQRIMGGETLSFEVEHYHKDGHTFPLSVNANLVSSGNERFIIAVHRDLTEHKRAEEAIRESEARFRSYVENAPIGVFICDGQGRYQEVNPAATAITGYTREELLALSIPDILPPESQELAAHYFQVVAETGRVSAEFAFRHKKGHLGFWSLEGVRLSPSRFMGLVIDVTARKEIEAERARLQDQLLQSQKMESVGRLAGGVAHDFNNMLGVILGHAEMAMEEVELEKLRVDLEEILKAANRSTDLTRQLLAFARKQTVSPIVLDLNETVEGMLKMLRRLIGEDVNLAWHPGVNTWPVKMDPSQIDQILANLSVNARDAIAGVGKVTIETQNVHCDEAYCVDHAGCIPGNYVLLAVSDDGCGMNKETQSKLFEPFFTTKGIGKGTGLGLATVYGIVKQNNGFIDVYSEPGQGTTFKIYLPRYIGKIEKAQMEGQLEPVAPGHETILVVEDEPSLLELSKFMLEKQGYRVLAASTPGEAIRLAEEYPEEIHLLMTDVVMPEMNGRELAKKILSLYPRTKRLFMSGYTADVIAHHGVLDEGVQFLQKPFSRAALAKKVREALEGK